MNTAAQQLTSDESTIQSVTFRLGAELYGINVLRVQEILRVTDITPVPDAPGYVLGIINLRGSVVTVIDARIRLGLPAVETTDLSRIIIIEGSLYSVGVLVDSVGDVTDVAVSDIHPAPEIGSIISQNFIQGVTDLGPSLLIMVDLDQLFSEEVGNKAAGL